MEHEAHNDQRVMRTLIGHFFRRFFDNDTVHVQGDTMTTVARALAAAAVPGLIVAFFLQTQYPPRPLSRPLWSTIEDQYLFVLLSFVVMGAVAIVEWEMLFPDRADFLVLTPLSLERWQMLAAKAAALSVFLLLFLFSVNALGTWMLPAVSKGDFFRHLWAHGAAVTLAGIFAALVLLGLGGLMLCVLDPRKFRVASPLLQMATVTILTLSLLHYLKCGDTLQALLTEPLGFARWYPPFWFLAVYEKLLHGPSAPAFASDLARYAYRSTGAAAAVVLVTYPLAWARMQRVAIEGVSGGGRQQWRWWSRLVERSVPRPAERAVVHFIGQTIARNARYQVYLAIYGGLGLALAVAFATEIQMTASGFRPALSKNGLHAILPLALFWAVAGLRSAFAFPLNLSAGWIFRVSGATATECGAAPRRWGLSFALALTAAVALVVASAGWSLSQIVVQLVCGACLGVLLTDAFFASNEHVPFNRPRMPGRANFPLMLTLYIAILPLYVLGISHLELLFERNFARLAMLATATILIHITAARLRHEPQIVEEDLEGYDDDFQLLGLS